MPPVDNLPIGPALLPLRVAKRSSRFMVAVVVGRALPREGRRQRGITAERHTAIEWEVIRDDLQCSLVGWANSRRPGVPQQLVVGDPGPSFPEDLRPGTLKRPRAALQQTGARAGGEMMPMAVQIRAKNSSRAPTRRRLLARYDTRGRGDCRRVVDEQSLANTVARPRLIPTFFLSANTNTARQRPRPQ